jgi:thioredoxin reductase
LVDLAFTLRGWSPRVTACSNGRSLAPEQVARLRAANIQIREEHLVRLLGRDGRLEELIFSAGAPAPCDALFFSSGQAQRSNLAETLGCQRDAKGLSITHHKQSSDCEGLYIAGDADGDVQFAIVAAAEGAIAAMAINDELLAEDGDNASSLPSRD